MKSKIVTLLFLSIATFTSSANSAPVSLYFSGELTSVYDQSNFLDGVTVGGTFNGELRFDPNNISYQDASGDEQIYGYPGANYNWYTSGNFLKVYVGSKVFETDSTSPNLNIAISNGTSESAPASQDNIVINSFIGQPYNFNGDSYYAIGWQFDTFENRRKDTISTAGLDEILNLNLLNWGQNGFGISGSVANPESPYLDLGNSYYLQGRVTSISLVPEPETYGMMLMGIGMLGFMARRQRAIKSNQK
jgi:hypothetical protein